jgi:hypothetical protein
MPGQARQAYGEWRRARWAETNRMYLLLANTSKGGNSIKLCMMTFWRAMEPGQSRGEVAYGR